MCTYNSNIYNLNKYNLYIKYNESVAFEINSANSPYNFYFWPPYSIVVMLLKLLMIEIH